MLEFKAIKGFFLQDELSPDSEYTTEKLGLITRDYPLESATTSRESQWKRFRAHVAFLREHAPPGVHYKVIFAARHGNGYHNQALHHYGREAWDAHWSKVDGDSTSTWADSRLTELGVSQAKETSDFWLALAKAEGVLPESYYVSPHERCLATARITWDPVHREFGEAANYKPLVKEKLRECYGVHTCDRRSSKSYIEREYPEMAIEKGFAMNDPYWTADHRETPPEMDVRFRELLDDIFRNDERTYISFTSHSGSIVSLLRVLGCKPLFVATGSVIPLFVEAREPD